MKKVLVALLFSIGALAVQAQTTAQMKIGYADVDYILAQMPEAKQVESELQSLNTQLQSQLQAKVQEYQQKLQSYQQSAAGMGDVVRQDKEEELMQLEQNIQKFQQNAQQSMEKKRNTLMEPLYTKLGNAIEKIAKANGYTHVLNGQIGGIDIVLYADQQYDVSNIVLKELGVAAPTAQE